MKDPSVHGGRGTQDASYATWGTGLLVFLFFELTGLERRHNQWLRKRVPWFTLSEADWSLLDRMPGPVRALVRGLLITFFTSLGLHFAYKTPLLP